MSMSIEDELCELLHEHELLCRTLAAQIPGEAKSDTLKEKLLKMADQAADLDVKLSTRSWNIRALDELEKVLVK